MTRNLAISAVALNDAALPNHSATFVVFGDHGLSADLTLSLLYAVAFFLWPLGSPFFAALRAYQEKPEPVGGPC